MTITLTQSGTLSTALSKINQSEFKKLVIKGELNNADVSALNSVSISTLDLSQAKGFKRFNNDKVEYVVLPNGWTREEVNTCESFAKLKSAASASNEATYVTSNENKVEDLTIAITEEDGKNYITYAIGSKSYKAEVLTSDVAIYVKSSSRVDDKDTNGVNVKISNDTALPVYIKVAGDDGTNPRFNLKEKAGSVKVY